ncbi:MAG: hypothetical protein K8S87_12205 [Planctomycetes bacterium]|nr:hypothetical protein [Planctomycetota bacterium]
MQTANSEISHAKVSVHMSKRMLYLIVILGLIMFLALSGCSRDDAENVKKATETKKPATSTWTKPEVKPTNAEKPTQNESLPDKKIDPTKPLIKTITHELILQEFIKKEAFSPTQPNPWLVAQGIKALGADSKMSSGKSAVEFLLEFTEKVRVEGEDYLKFRKGAYFDALTDANPNMILKTLVDANADIYKEYETKQGTISLKMLINDAKMLLRPDIYDKIEHPNLDWTIELFAEVINPKQYQWVNAYGEIVDFKKIVEKNFTVLENHMNSIENDFKNENRRISGRSLIHGDIDGGAHLFCSTARAVHKGFGNDSMKKRLQKQAELVFYRLKYEPLLYQTLHKGVKEKNIPDNVRRSRLWLSYRDFLMFYAHQLESVQLIKKFNIITIDDKKKEILDKAYENLGNLIILMHAESMFKWIHNWNIKNSDKRAYKHIIYHDIVADSCQAYKVLKQK